MPNFESTGYLKVYALIFLSVITFESDWKQIKNMNMKNRLHSRSASRSAGQLIACSCSNRKKPILTEKSHVIFFFYSEQPVRRSENLVHKLPS